MNRRYDVSRSLLLCGLLSGLSLTGCRLHTMYARHTMVQAGRTVNANIDVNVNGRAINGNGGVVVSGHYAGKGVEAESRQTFQAERTHMLKLTGENGNVTVTAASEGVNQIMVHATRQLQGSRSTSQLQALLPELKVTTALAGDKLIVKSEHPRAWDNDGISAGVSYEITVPAHLMVDVTDVNGSVNVQGTQGGIEIRDENGNVQLNHVAGAIHAATTNGSIGLENAGHCTDVRLRSENGNVNAAHVERMETPPNVDIATTNGSVEYTGLAAGLTLATTNGNVIATLKGSPNDAHISSDNGSLTLHLPSNISARLTADTTNGTVNAPHATTNDERTSAQATLGGGRAAIILTTTNGNITVETP